MFELKKDVTIILLSCTRDSLVTTLFFCLAMVLLLLLSRKNTMRPFNIGMKLCKPMILQNF